MTRRRDHRLARVSRLSSVGVSDFTITTPPRLAPLQERDTGRPPDLFRRTGKSAGLSPSSQFGNAI
jgi:hypothetical protein